MSYLDKEGLTYYNNKLNQKFVQSVNNTLPDDGNVMITTVATAENLLSEDAVESYGEFTYRTSGGDAQINSGDATLVYVDGATQISGAVQESFQYECPEGISANVYDSEAWRLQFSSASSYVFNYTRPTTDSDVGSWIGNGSWKYDSNPDPIILSSYGISVSGVVSPQLELNSTVSGLGLTINPSTWMEKVDSGGIPSDTSIPITYTFVYRKTIDTETETTTARWELNNEEVSLSEYGLEVTLNGITLNNNDSFSVTYTYGTGDCSITITYTPESQGTLSFATWAYLESTGFNQFNKNDSSMYLINSTIDSSGTIIDGDNYVCYVKAKGGVPLGYIAYAPVSAPSSGSMGDASASGRIVNVGWSDSKPQKNVSHQINTTQSNEQEIFSESGLIASKMSDTDGYFVVEVVTDKNTLCIHTRWDSEEDYVYEAFKANEYVMAPAYQSNDQPLPMSVPNTYNSNYPYIRMPSIGTTADRFNAVTATYIQKIVVMPYSGDNLEIARNYANEHNTQYLYDNNYVLYELIPSEYYVYSGVKDGQKRAITGKYTVNDFGTESFVGSTVPAKAEFLYGENLRNKLKGDVLTISTQTPAFTDKQIQSIRKNLIDIIYPVGSIYCSVQSSNPETIWGGKWNSIKNRFLVGAGDSYAVQSTGGEATHKLTIGELPSHKHDKVTLTGYTHFRSVQPSAFQAFNQSSGIIKNIEQPSTPSYIPFASTGSVNKKTSKLIIDASHQHAAIGSGQAHNNLPPYYAVYMWRRTE